MSEALIVTRTVHCAFCGRPVSIAYQSAPDQSGSWFCPDTSCARENTISNLRRVVSVTPDVPVAVDEPNLLMCSQREQCIARHLARRGVRVLSVVVGDRLGGVTVYAKVDDVIQRFFSHAGSDTAASTEIAARVQAARKTDAR